MGNPSFLLKQNILFPSLKLYLKRKMALRQMLGRNKKWLAAEASPLVAAVGVAFGALVFFGARTAMTASDVNFKKRSVEEQKDYSGVRMRRIARPKKAVLHQQKSNRGKPSGVVFPCSPSS